MTKTNTHTIKYKTILQDHMTKQTPTQSRQEQYYKITCQNKHQRNEDKTILQDQMSKQTPTQSRQNNNTRSDEKTNTHTIKTRQYYKMTWQNKHWRNQGKTILQDHVSKQTPAQSWQNNNKRTDDKTNNPHKTKRYYQMTSKNKHHHNEDKTILQDQITKQTPTQSIPINITRSHFKTNTCTVNTKKYYKITCQHKHPHNQNKTILSNSHVKTNTHAIQTK